MHINNFKLTDSVIQQPVIICTESRKSVLHLHAEQKLIEIIFHLVIYFEGLLFTVFY